MKSRIPKTITVGGYEYKIKYPYIFKQSDIQVGIHEPNTQTIKISKFVRNQERHWVKILDTLIHEIVHAVDCIYNAGLLEEFEVEAVGYYLLQIIRDNDFDFNKKEKLFDTIKIGPFTYKIEWNYTFEDHDYMPAMVDHQVLTMWINPVDTNSTPISHDVRMSTLFYLILLAINNITGIQDGFDCNEESPTKVAKSMVVSFANGLYRVIKDNNLVKILKSNKDLGGK